MLVFLYDNSATEKDGQEKCNESLSDSEPDVDVHSTEMDEHWY